VSLDLSYDYENLFSKGLDLAFRFSHIEDDRLIIREIGTSRRVLVASNQYLSKSGLIRNIEDISQHKCLLFQGFDEFSSWELDNGKESISLSVTGPFQCSNIEILKEATLKGMGIGFIPLFAIQDELADKRLINVQPDWSRKTKILAAYRTGSHQSPKLSAFLSCIEENAHLFNIK
jgi:DNA-binding transcriptional LysR family regulator